MPFWLRSALFRNGAGRNDLTSQWFPHWFDGDGMISAIRFDDRGIHYRNRYVATENYRQETRAGHIVNRGFGKMRPGGVLANAFRQPANVSNTSVVMQGGRLLSLWEGGPPFALDPVTLDTRGIETFGGTVKAFSAHPKVDPDSGELFNFGIDYGAKDGAQPPHRIDRAGLTRLAADYPALSGDEPRFRADQEPSGVLHRADPRVHSLKLITGPRELRRRHALGTGPPDVDLMVPRDVRLIAALDRNRAVLWFHFAQRFRAGRHAGAQPWRATPTTR